MRNRTLAVLAGVTLLTAGGAFAEPARQIVVEVPPVDIGDRKSDERPARVKLDFDKVLADAKATGRVDFDSIRVTDQSAPGGQGAERPFRWYDADIPNPFPEFIGQLARTEGKLRPRPSPMAGYLYNTAGSGKRGFLAFTHTQRGNAPGRYVISFNVVPEGQAHGTGPRGWLGDGQIRCAELADDTTGCGHTRIDLDDWNDDGLIDIIFGEEAGCLFVIPNVGTKTQPKFLHKSFVNDAKGNPIDIGTHNAPLVIDFDGDGVKDLLIGNYTNRIAWYRNTGTNKDRKLEYVGVVHSEGKPLELPRTPIHGVANEAIFGHDYYPVLTPIDWNNDGKMDLLAGGYVTGRVFLLENTGKADDGGMALALREPIQADGKVLFVGGWCAAPCVADFNADGRIDLISGRQPMGDKSKGDDRFLCYFEGTGEASQRLLTEKPLPHQGKFPSTGLGTPRAADLNGDGLLDLVVSARKNIYYFPNIGTRTEPKFEAHSEPIRLPWGSSPLPVDQFVDYDRDGKPDLFDRYAIRLNTGAPSPFAFGQGQSMLAPGTHIAHPTGIGDDWFWPYVSDFDQDGDWDILFGDWHGTIWFHRNEGGDASKQFDLTGYRLQTTEGTPIKVGPVEKDPNANFAALQGARTVFAARDVDGDGLTDRVVGDTYGIVRYYRNAGPKDKPLFEPAVEGGTVTSRGSVDLTDWDGDGDLDIIAGASNGTVRVFPNTGQKGAAKFGEGIDPKLPPLKQPRVMMVDLNGDGDEDLYVPSLQGSVLIERSFLKHGYAEGKIVGK